MENFMVNIGENFNITEFAEEVMQQFQAEGFQVNILKMKNGVKLVLKKKCGGINNLLGLGQAITATCMFQGKEHDMLSVSFSDAEWLGKIVGLVAGWFLCMIPFITAIIGTIRQMGLPNKVEEAMQAVISNSEE